MSLEYHIDTTQQLVTITGEYARPDEWQEFFARLLADPRRQPGLAYLRDLRGATSPVDAAAVIKIVDLLRGVWPRLQGFRAAIVTSTTIDPAAVAHALATEQHLPLMAFTSYEQAMDWLHER